jgi:hypothetical protein
MGELAGRDVNGVADARAGGLDAGKRDGFQQLLSFGTERRMNAEIEKPPAAVAGDGLEDLVLLLVDQAPIPACAMGLIIRMVGTNGAACRTGCGFALALKLRIALIEVEQRERWASRVRENRASLFLGQASL